MTTYKLQFEKLHKKKIKKKKKSCCFFNPESKIYLSVVGNFFTMHMSLGMIIHGFHFPLKLPKKSQIHSNFRFCSSKSQ